MLFSEVMAPYREKRAECTEIRCRSISQLSYVTAGNQCALSCYM